jgi:hypothetical protein
MNRAVPPSASVEMLGAGQDLYALVASLQEEVQQLRREVLPLRAEAGYWKSRHADALQRNEQLKAQLEQAQAEIRQLKERLLGRKAECRLAGQKIAELVDEDRQRPARKRGDQAGHTGHRRASIAHLPARAEFCELVYQPQEGKVGYRWWLWVILSPQCIVYLIDAHRSHDVPENHFPAEAQGILMVDRYSAYQAMRQVKLGLLLLAFCWAHVRRDFLEVGRGNRELVPWTLAWPRRIRDVYRTNTRRLEHAPGSSEFQHEDARLREQLAAMDHQTQAELAEEKLRVCGSGRASAG